MACFLTGTLLYPGLCAWADGRSVGPSDPGARTGQGYCFATDTAPVEVPNEKVPL